MQFNSFHFLLFFGISVVLGILLRRRVTFRNVVLLAASYYFYACWDWRFLSLILLSTLVDYCCGLAFDIREVDEDHPPPATRRRKLILAISLMTNLSLLGFFKYYDFFITSAADLLGSFGFHGDPWTLRIILPVGISFYTFQTLSYTFDLYRGRIRTERNFLTFALFVSFFPQLVAGPIERAKNLLPQIAGPVVIDREKIYSGLYLVLWGLFKKTVLADNAGAFVQAIFGNEPTSGLFSLLAVYAFQVQVYCDFSAYSDIARGTARLMGFDLMLNFNLPFFATSATDFWQRWHISLSSWLRDYLYYPLGGNRKGKWRTYVNQLITMTLGGLWHGANWTFVLWGLWSGLLLVAHRLLLPVLRRINFRPGSVKFNTWWFVRVFGYFNLFVLSLVFFRSPSVGYSMRMFRTILLDFPGPVPNWLSFGKVLSLAACCAVLLIVQTLQYRTRDLNFVFRLPTVARAFYYAAMLLGIIIFGSLGGDAFIYFQF